VNLGDAAADRVGAELARPQLVAVGVDTALGTAWLANVAVALGVAERALGREALVVAGADLAATRGVLRAVAILIAHGAGSAAVGGRAARQPAPSTGRRAHARRASGAGATHAFGIVEAARAARVWLTRANHASATVRAGAVAVAVGVGVTHAAAPGVSALLTEVVDIAMGARNIAISRVTASSATCVDVTVARVVGVAVRAGAVAALGVSVALHSAVV